MNDIVDLVHIIFSCASNCREYSLFFPNKFAIGLSILCCCVWRIWTDLDLFGFVWTLNNTTVIASNMIARLCTLLRLCTCKTFWLWIWVVADFQKDLLKCSYRNTVSLNVQCLQVIVEICEEVFEERCVLTGDLHCHFSLNLCQFTAIWSKLFNHVWHDLLIGSRVVLDNSHDVAHTKTILEEHRRA